MPGRKLISIPRPVSIPRWVFSPEVLNYFVEDAFRLTGLLNNAYSPRDSLSAEDRQYGLSTLEALLERWPVSPVAILDSHFREALSYNLAAALSRSYGPQPHPLLAAMAEQTHNCVHWP